MNLITQLACGAGVGISAVALYGAWRKCAQRWARWSPTSKKVLTIVFWAWALATALSTIVLTQGASVDLAYLLGGIAMGFGVSASVLPLLLKSTLPPASPVTAREPILASASSVRTAIANDRVPTRLTLGGIPLPFKAEPQHLLVTGTAGAGKSPAINELLLQLRAANDTVIVLDAVGEFLSQHYRKGTDFILNPFDSRCVNWSPVQEIHSAADFHALGCSIVPDDSRHAPEHVKAAQGFVADILQKMSLEKGARLASLLYFVEEAGVSELKQLLRGASSSELLSRETYFGTVRKLAVERLKAYEFLPDEGAPFSISEMIAAEHSGFLFLTHQGEKDSHVEGLLSCALDVAARAILAQPPNTTRRTWLVLDGLGVIGKVQSLGLLAERGAEVGGCIVISLQAVTDLVQAYGEAGTEHLLSNVGSWLVLRSDKVSAELLIPGLGLPEFVPSEVIASQAKKAGKTVKTVVRKSMSYVEKLRTLAPMQGYLRVAGGYDICEVDVTPAHPNASKARAFDARDFLVKPKIRAAAPGTLPDGADVTVSTLARLVPELPPMPADSQILLTRHDQASRQGNRLSSVLKSSLNR